MSDVSGFVKKIRDIMRNDAGINGDAQRIEQLVWILFLKVYQVREDDWELEEDDFVSPIPQDCRWATWAKNKYLTGDELLKFVNDALFPTLKGLDVIGRPVRERAIPAVFEDANNYMKDGVLLRQVVDTVDALDFGDKKTQRSFLPVYEAILKELQSAGSSGEFYTPRAVTEFMARVIRPQIGERMADFACGTGGFLIAWLDELKKLASGSVDAYEQYQGSVYGIEKKQFPHLLCVTNLILHGIDEPKVYHDNALKRDLLDYTEKDAFDVILMNPPYGGSEKAEIKNHFPADRASSETADLFMNVIMQRLKRNGRAGVVLPDGFLFGTDNAKVNIKKKLLEEYDLHTIVRLPGSIFNPYTSITTNLLFFDRKGKTEKTWFYRLDMPEGYKNFSKTKPMKLEHFEPVLQWWDDRKEITVDGFDKAKCYSATQLAEEFGYNLDLCGFPHEEEEILEPMDLIRRYREKRASLDAEIDRTLDQIASLLGGRE